MKRILILAHREELIYQAVGHARNAGLSAGMEMGSHRARKEEVIVSTVQTLNSASRCVVCGGDGCDRCNGVGKVKRMTKFDPWDFGLVITDEGHHGTAKSYRSIYKWFTQNEALKLLFVTATPMRADGIGLHNVCDSVAYEMPLKAAIDSGWLVPIRQQFITVDGLDLSKVGTKPGGDLKDGELQRVFLGEGDVEEEKMLHAIMKPTIDKAAGQQFIVFASGIEHAEKLTAAGNAYDGVTCELILGGTNKDERKRIVRRFKNGETQGLINVGVATEGFDCPAAAVIAIARPTKSESLYLQMIGRGTRPLPGVVDGPATADLRRAAIAESGKPTCLILDFIGNSGEHKLVSVADVLAGDGVDPLDLAEAVRVAKDADGEVDVAELIEKAKASREEQAAREAEQRKQRQSTRHYAERADYTATDVDLFDGENFDPFTDYVPAPDGATQRQVNLLLSMGVAAHEATQYSKRQAGKVIDSLQKKQVGGEFRMPFGRFKGRKLKDLPSTYIDWVRAMIHNHRVREHIAIMDSEQHQEAF